ncbi:hypothetical protein EON65_15410 [archaeon]|nr:MAG: hypothetical protein EON65_15410 [archaeon]
MQTGYKNKSQQVTAHHLITLKREKEHQRKRQNIAEMKALTQSNIDFVKSQIEEERSIIRLQRPDSFEDIRLLSPRSEVSSASSTSFIIKVPEEMRDRVKKAKRCVFNRSHRFMFYMGVPTNANNLRLYIRYMSSQSNFFHVFISLLQYTAAKQEIKDFQEQVYSEKLRSIAIRKHLARQLSKDSGSHLHFNQIDGTEYFSDDNKEMNKLRSVMSFDDTINSDLDDHSIQLSVK